MVLIDIGKRFNDMNDVLMIVDNSTLISCLDLHNKKGKDLYGRETWSCDYFVPFRGFFAYHHFDLSLVVFELHAFIGRS